MLVRPTLGQQPVVLGGLFSAVENEFIPGLALWPREVIQQYSSTIFHPRMDTKWTKGLSYKEKLDLLQIDVDGDISIDLDIGKIAAHGSFHYLDKEEVIKKII